MTNITQKEINDYIDYQIERTSNPTTIVGLEKLREDALNRQFVDAPEGLSHDEYRKWLKKARNTFLATIPVESSILGDVRNLGNHSKEEMERPVMNNLNHNQIIDILDSLNLYTIMALSSDSVRIDKLSNLNIRGQLYNYDVRPDSSVIVGYSKHSDIIGFPHKAFNRDLEDRSIYKSRDGIRSIITIDINDKVIEKKTYENAYKHLFSSLLLPVSTVISSINEVTTRYNSGIPYDDKLCEQIEKYLGEALDNGFEAPIRQRKTM